MWKLLFDLLTVDMKNWTIDMKLSVLSVRRVYNQGLEHSRMKLLVAIPNLVQSKLYQWKIYNGSIFDQLIHFQMDHLLLTSHKHMYTHSQPPQILINDCTPNWLQGLRWVLLLSNNSLSACRRTVYHTETYAVYCIQYSILSIQYTEVVFISYHDIMPTLKMDIVA